MDELMHIAAVGAALCLASCLLILSGRQLARFSDAFVRLPAVQKVVLILGVTAATVCAQKGGTNGIAGTDGAAPPCLVASAPLAPTTGAGFAVSPADVARGYRLESVSTNSGLSYVLPADATVIGTWHQTGAYEDVVRVGWENDGWRFPLGSHLCDRLWAYAWGKVRPQLKNASNEIAAVGAPMSAIPNVSRFWTAETINGARLLMWEDFALGRLPKGATPSALSNALVSAQIELYPDGDFITRSNDVESVYRRVNPDDWDDDGIPNEDDDEPCCRVDDNARFGPNQDLSFTANRNAYCWVDLVVRQANARVTFAGDGPSDLPDPDFIAEAGTTNRVSLLIGKTYKVTCALPFEVVGKSSEELETSWDADGSLWLHWPVDIQAQDDGEEQSMLLFAAPRGVPRRHGFTMRVKPSGLGGVFSWTNCCCSISGSGYSFSQNCNEGCSCGGCTAVGYFSYEGYRLPAWGGSCACGWYGGDEPGGDDDPDEPVGVSARFTKKVIFFEDEYENTPTETVPWRSTTSELVCSAYGGERGGFVTISLSGAGGLVQDRGLPLPVMHRLEPYEVFAFTNAYRAVAASGSENDIKVTADFVESDTGWVETAQDRATAVKVEIKPAVRAPENKCDYRHKFGVLEIVNCIAKPKISCLVWRCSRGARIANDEDAWQYTCPIHSQDNGIWIEGGGAIYMPMISVVEPCGVKVSDVSAIGMGLDAGQAGGVMLRMRLHALPMDVSFSNVMFEEVPCAGGDRTGYFEDAFFMNEWYHGKAQGAGQWEKVIQDNEFLFDHAGLKTALPQLDDKGRVSPWGTNGWVSGTLTGRVPCGWGDRNVREDDEPHGTFANDALQVMTIDAEGNCEVRKYNNTARRDITGETYLNGVLQ